MANFTVHHVCVHEAAHAIASVVFGRRIKRVEIGDDGTGHCVGIRIDGPITRSRAAAQVVIHLSGGIGESISRGVSDADQVLAYAETRCGCSTDLRRARVLIRDHGLDERAMVMRTRSLLLRHWPAVELVARGLVENGSVKGDQLERWVWYAS